MEYIGYYNSPIGNICIMADDSGITNLDFIDKELSQIEKLNPIIKQCISELKEYFD